MPDLRTYINDHKYGFQENYM